MPAARSRLPLGASKLAHVVVVALGWAGFVWMWLLVGRQPWESARLYWLIAGSIVVLPLVTGAWVWHNRALYRRKGERRAVARAEAAYAYDWHGRSVDADWQDLKHSRYVTVSVSGRRKLYRNAAPAMPDPGTLKRLAEALGAGAPRVGPIRDTADTVPGY